MRTRLVSAQSVVADAVALVSVPASSASAAVPGQDFEGFTTGLVDGQHGWTVTNHSFDYTIADTTGLFGGALGTRAPAGEQRRDVGQLRRPAVLRAARQRGR